MRYFDDRCVAEFADTLKGAERSFDFNFDTKKTRNKPCRRRAASRHCIFVNALMRYAQSPSLMNVFSRSDSSKRRVPLSDTSSRKYRGTSSPRRKCSRCRSSSERRSCILRSNARKSNCASIQLRRALPEGRSEEMRLYIEFFERQVTTVIFDAPKQSRVGTSTQTVIEKG